MHLDEILQSLSSPLYFFSVEFCTALPSSNPTLFAVKQLVSGKGQSRFSQLWSDKNPEFQNRRAYTLTSFIMSPEPRQQYSVGASFTYLLDMREKFKDLNQKAILAFGVANVVIFITTSLHGTNITFNRLQRYVMYLLYEADAVQKPKWRQLQQILTGSIFLKNICIGRL